MEKDKEKTAQDLNDHERLIKIERNIKSLSWNLIIINIILIMLAVNSCLILRDLVNLSEILKLFSRNIVNISDFMRSINELFIGICEFLGM